jgi:uncharacterized protein
LTRVTPYAEPSAAKLPRYTVADPYLRFWLRFVQSGTEMIARGRGDLAAARVLEGWSEYRGRAIEPLIRESIERMLPHPVLGDASVAGSYWTTDNRTAVDIVGGREPLRARG